MSDMNTDAEIVKEAVVYVFEESGYTFRATYLSIPKGEALIEISKGAVLVKKFLFPGYKVWNIPAHAKDIVADIEVGLSIAGSDGLGGNAYQGAHR